MNTQCTGIEPSVLARMLELLLPLDDSEGTLAGAIDRLERGDIDGGLDAARAVLEDVVDRVEESGQ